MNISKTNCEAFFLDYYEGTLSEEQVAEMFAFLKANPEFRQVFESFGHVSLEADKPSSSDFSFLKKEPVADEHVLAEQWMVDDVDNAITAEDAARLEKYLTQYPAKRTELDLLKKTKLQADGEEVFGDLSLLKKTTVITAGNFDDYALRAVEGSISPADNEALVAFVQANPEFEKQLAHYRATRLTADASVRLGDLSFLKKASIVVSEENIMELLFAKAEGELSASEEQGVEEYLVRFPQYRKELELFLKSHLSPDSAVVFHEKDKLKKGALLINESNVEHYAISAAEGLLNGEEQKALETFVAAHPKYRKLVAAYSAVQLTPDLAVVYSDKEGLKRKARGGFWTANVRYAAAAVLVLLLGIYFWTKFAGSTGDVKETPVANNIPNNTNPVQPGQNTVVPPAPAKSDQLADAGTNPPAPVKNNVIVKQDVHGTPTGVMDNTYTPVRIVANHIQNEADDAVYYSNAGYEAGSNPVAVQAPGKYISAGQFVMRWMKDKIDGDDEMRRDEENVDHTLAENRQKDENVDGLDLTESAVNRVGESAANGNISMDQREDGTYLHLWKYSVRVSKAN